MTRRIAKQENGRENGREDGKRMVRVVQESVARPPREVIKQASRDLDRGLVDTDRGPQTNRLSKTLKPGN